MLGDLKRHPRADAEELTLERLICEGHQLAAAVANEMVVMTRTMTQRLETNYPLPDLDPHHELGSFELLEDAVDAGARHAPILVLERRLQLNRRQRAVLAREQPDQAVARAATTVARRGQSSAGALGPVVVRARFGRAHETILVPNHLANTHKMRQSLRLR